MPDLCVGYPGIKQILEDLAAIDIGGRDLIKLNQLDRLTSVLANLVVDLGLELDYGITHLGKSLTAQSSISKKFKL